MSRGDRDLPLVLLPGWGMPGRVFDDLRAHLCGQRAPALEAVTREKDGPRGRANKALPERAAGPGFLARRRPLPSASARLAGRLPQRCDLLGWSMGGLQAIELASQEPRQVRRLVLMSATPSFVRRRGWNAGIPRVDFEDFCWRLAQDLPATLRHFQGLTARGDDRERAVLRALRAAAAGDLPDPVALRAGLDLLRSADLRSRAAAIAAPTLVVHGARDGLVPLAAGHWLARRIRGARLATLPGAAHAPFLSDPAACASVIADFLAAP